MSVRLSSISVALIIAGSLFGLLIAGTVLKSSIDKLLSQEEQRLSRTLADDAEEQFSLLLEGINEKIQKIVIEKDLQRAIEKKDNLYLNKALIKISSGNFPFPTLMIYISYNDSNKNSIKHLFSPTPESTSLIKQIEKQQRDVHYQVIKNNEKLLLVFSGRISGVVNFKKNATLRVVFNLGKNSFFLKNLQKNSRLDCLSLVHGLTNFNSRSSVGSGDCLKVLHAAIKHNETQLLSDDSRVVTDNNFLMVNKRISNIDSIKNIHILGAIKTSLFETQKQQLLNIMLTVASVLILSSIFTSMVSTRIIRRSVKELINYVKQDFEGNHFQYPKSNFKIDEFTEIASAYSAVRQKFVKEENERLMAETEKIRLSQKIHSLQAQKMEALGTLTAGVAHDFNNMLAIIKGNLDLIKISRGNSKILTEALDVMSATTDRGAAIVSDLMLYVRNEKTLRKERNLITLLESVSKMIPSLINGYRIELKVIIEEHKTFMVKLDQDKFSISLINLVSNARGAMPKGGLLSIHLRSISDKEVESIFHLYNGKKYCLLEVADSGTGIDLEIQDKIFEPFFTTKKIGQGTGMGLSIVYEFINEMGGEIRVTSNKKLGTVFQLLFPLI